MAEIAQNPVTPEQQPQPQTPAEEEVLVGPPKIGIFGLLLKVFAGGAGGVIGTVVLLVIFLIAQSILTPLTSDRLPDDYISPLFIFLLMIMIFLSSTIGNIVSTWLLSLTESKKYQRTASAIYQVFIVSIIIFILMVPVYFITSSIDLSIVAYAVGLHIIISAQVSALILEIVSNYRHALVGVYGVTFSILISAGILFGLAAIIPSPAILLFAALPIVWGSIALMQGLVTIIYGWIARTYDKDFLSTQTLYGSDYGKQVESTDEEKKPKVNEGGGADFLRRK